jgi:hypothetical protein
MIRVVLPAHLRRLAQVDGEVQVDVTAPITQRSVIEAIETTYPVLVGTIRDRESKERRPLVRFFADKRDLSHEPLDTPLPECIVNGREPYMIIGAMAGG